MQLLIVDDDQYIRRGLSRAMKSAAPRDWVTTTACSGEEALELLAERSFDVIVSDMRMPGVDGPALLAAVRERWPDAARLVLSGHADLRDAVRVAPIAHQFLDKPIRPGELVAIIAGVVQARARIPAGPLRDALGALGDLPCAPASYAELVHLAGETSSTEQVIALVQADPALAATVLKLASTSFFTRGVPVADVRAAVHRLGAATVRSTLLARATGPAAEVATLVDEVRVRALAAVARVGATAHPGSYDDAHAAALLAELGIVALAAACPTESVAVARAVAAGGDRAELERERWGVTHADVGAYLLGLWGLPPAVVDAVAGQPPPPMESSTPSVPWPSAIKP